MDESTTTHLTFSRKKVVQQINKLFNNKHRKFIDTVITYGYSKFNNFHNMLHVYEVVQITCMLIKHIGQELSKRDKFLLKVAALCHDIYHQGYNNNKLEYIMSSISSNELFDDENFNDIRRVNSSFKSSCSGGSFDDLTNIASDKSFNEEYHVNKALQIINKFELLSKKHEKSEIAIIRSLILSTSLNVNDEYMKYLKKNDPNLNTISKMILILKLADISHTWSRDFRTHSYWVFKRFEEDDETFESTKDLASNTIGFMEHFVEPLLNFTKTAVDSTIYEEMYNKYISNKNTWAEYRE